MKWYNETQAADWRNFSDLKKTFNTADAVANDRYIFDIKGNQYRLIALIIFKVRTVFILFIGTHKEYDKMRIFSSKKFDISSGRTTTHSNLLIYKRD